MKLSKYISGFVLSIALTLISYNLVTNQKIEGNILLFIISGLAVVQTLVQLTFFIHLDTEGKPRWNLLIFVSTVSVILILVIGSILIMNNLNYRHDIPTDQTIIQNEGLNR